jgi:hypothetical protein
MTGVPPDPRAELLRQVGRKRAVVRYCTVSYVVVLAGLVVVGVPLWIVAAFALLDGVALLGFSRVIARQAAAAEASAWTSPLS